ncbi:MAG TPA: hypothetical protein VHM92_11750 [Allosphingosinicella sp.]|nr:hypothetical protein [Allosphingosinicella sp.]
MADPRLPSEIDEYMIARGWPAHHARWHYEQRHDFWRHRAAQGDENAAAIVAEAEAKGWGRGETQEGAAGHGLQFLSMHRAMLELLLEAFPQHADFFEGWPTPPRDPADPDDPVPDGAEFPADKAEGVRLVETGQRDFPDEDGYALFLETNIEPRPDDPTYRVPDGRRNLHNWLHNRWSDDESPVDIGDPERNLFNARFWRLHGWIDRLWTGYRSAWGLADDDPGYRARIDHHRHMMAHPHHHGMAEWSKRAGRAEAEAGAAEAMAPPGAMRHFFDGEG